MSHESDSEFSISPEFHEFIPAVILRLKYIFPDLDFEKTACGVKYGGPPQMDTVRLEREINYQIYREKIFQQTLPMRRNLYDMLAT